MKKSRIELIKNIAQNIENYSPLLILGKPGSGKSFFLERLCKELKDIGKINRYDIVESWDFQELLIRAIRSGKVGPWRKGILHQEVHVYDDFDYLSGMEQTQEEMLYILKSTEKPVIIASNCKIAKSKKKVFSEELIQHFQEATIIDLDSPIYRVTYEDTNEYLKSRIESKPVILNDEAYSWLTNQKFENYATVKGLTKLLALSSRFDTIDFPMCYVLTKQYLTDPDVDKWINNILMAKFAAKSSN